MHTADKRNDELRSSFANFFLYFFLFSSPLPQQKTKIDFCVFFSGYGAALLRALGGWRDHSSAPRVPLHDYHLPYTSIISVLKSLSSTLSNPLSDVLFTLITFAGSASHTNRYSFGEASRWTHQRARQQTSSVEVSYAYCARRPHAQAHTLGAACACHGEGRWSMLAVLMWRFYLHLMHKHTRLAQHVRHGERC